MKFIGFFVERCSGGGGGEGAVCGVRGRSEGRKHNILVVIGLGSLDRAFGGGDSLSTPIHQPNLNIPS